MSGISNTNPSGSPYPNAKSDETWRSELSPFEYHVLREAGTEPAWTGKLPPSTTGVYQCRACGAELFRSSEKFDSQCGWPSFFSPLAGDRVVELDDYDLGYRRTEVRCAGCGSHLGHVFAGEGFDTPTDLRYCINAVCLKPAD
jgi:peptide-methionine (R)-S-oxide reductase